MADQGDDLEPGSVVPQIGSTGAEQQVTACPLLRCRADHAQVSLTGKRVAGDAEQRQLAAASGRLDRAELEPPADPEHLLPDVRQPLTCGNGRLIAEHDGQSGTHKSTTDLGLSR